MESPEEVWSSRRNDFSISVAFTTLLFFILLGSALYLRNNEIIKRPEIYVTSASVSPLEISVFASSILTPEWKVTLLTAVWNLTFAIQNPNKKFAMSFKGFDFNVSYGEDFLSSGAIKGFDLKEKEFTLVNRTISALPAFVSEQAAMTMQDELQRSEVVRFNITIKGLMKGNILRGIHDRDITTYCTNVKTVFSSNSSAGKMLGHSKCRVLWCGSILRYKDVQNHCGLY